MKVPIVHVWRFDRALFVPLLALLFATATAFCFRQGLRNGEWLSGKLAATLPAYCAELSSDGHAPVTCDHEAMAVLSRESMLVLALRPIERITDAVYVRCFLQHNGQVHPWSVEPERTAAGVFMLRAPVRELPALKLGDNQLLCAIARDARSLNRGSEQRLLPPAGRGIAVVRVSLQIMETASLTDDSREGCTADNSIGSSVRPSSGKSPPTSHGEPDMPPEQERENDSPMPGPDDKPRGGIRSLTPEEVDQAKAPPAPRFSNVRTFIPDGEASDPKRK